MTSQSESFWSMLTSRVGMGSSEPSDAELARRLDEVDDVPLRPDVIDRIVRRVAELSLQVEAIPQALVRDRRFTSKRLGLGGLLLLGACAFTTKLFWNGRNSTFVLEIPAGIATSHDTSRIEETRHSSVISLAKFAVTGLKALKRVAEEEPPLGEDARRVLEQLRDVWSDPANADDGRVETPFREVARFLLDRGNGIEARRGSIVELADQVRAAMIGIHELEISEDQPDLIRAGIKSAIAVVGKHI